MSDDKRGWSVDRWTRFYNENPPYGQKPQMNDEELTRQRDVVRRVIRDAIRDSNSVTFEAVGIGNKPGGDTVTFKQGTAYWSQSQPHSILSSYMRGIGRKRWNLRDGTGTQRGMPDFEVPMQQGCRMQAKAMRGFGNPSCLYFNASHVVPEEAVFVYCTDVLGMVPPEPQIKEVIVEKIVEKEVGLSLTFEKREALSFALTRELLLTDEELRRAYFEGEGDHALRVAARRATIRELMVDLGVEEVSGSPSWMLPRKEPEGDQMEIFDAVRD